MPGSSCKTELRKLLLDLFVDVGDLRIFIGDHYSKVEDAVEWDRSLRIVTKQIVDKLGSRGDLDATFFQLLLSDFDKRAEAIRRVRELCIRHGRLLGDFDPNSGSIGIRKETQERESGAGLYDFTAHSEGALSKGSVTVRLADEARRSLLEQFPGATAKLPGALTTQLARLRDGLDEFELGEALDELADVSLGTAALVRDTDPSRRRELSSLLTRMKEVYLGLAKKAALTDQLVLTLASGYWVLEEEAAFRYAIRESTAGTKFPSSDRSFAASLRQPGTRATQHATVRPSPMHIRARPSVAAHRFGKVQSPDKRTRSARPGAPGSMMVSRYQRSVR